MSTWEGCDETAHTRLPICHFPELNIPGADGTTAAVGWILHHSYFGAFPKNSPIKGLRLRSGNMQIGEADADRGGRTLGRDIP